MNWAELLRDGGGLALAGFALWAFYRAFRDERAENRRLTKRRRRGCDHERDSPDEG